MAQNILIELKIPTWYTFIRQYKAHKRAVFEKLPITEWRVSPSKEAQADYRRVTEELQRNWS